MLTFQPTTFFFQIINFFILLFVLRRFLYRPLMNLVQQREDEITTRLHEADERMRLAQTERERSAQQSHDAQIAQEAELARLAADAARDRTEILQRARAEAAQLLEQASQRAQEQERAAHQQLEVQVRQTALAVAGQLIVTAAGPAVHQSLLEKLLTDSAGLAGDERAMVARALLEAHGHVIVELAYPASPDLGDRFRVVFASMLPAEAGPLEVETRLDPSLLAGARILAGTAAVDLSLRRTLDELGDAGEASPISAGAL